MSGIPLAIARRHPVLLALIPTILAGCSYTIEADPRPYSDDPLPIGTELVYRTVADSAEGIITNKLVRVHDSTPGELILKLAGSRRTHYRLPEGTSQTSENYDVSIYDLEAMDPAIRLKTRASGRVLEFLYSWTDYEGHKSGILYLARTDAGWVHVDSPGGRRGELMAPSRESRIAAATSGYDGFTVLNPDTLITVGAGQFRCILFEQWDDVLLEMREYWNSRIGMVLLERKFPDVRTELVELRYPN